MIPKLFQSKIFYFPLEKFCICACTVLHTLWGWGVWAAADWPWRHFLTRFPTLNIRLKMSREAPLMNGRQPVILETGGEEDE